jgi:hypothetical protein
MPKVCGRARRRRRKLKVGEEGDFGNIHRQLQLNKLGLSGQHARGARCGGAFSSRGRSATSQLAD